MNTVIISSDSFRLITIAMFAALTMSCGAAAIAGDDAHVPQAVVKFGDLTPASPQGATTLYRRIVSAAYEVCKSFGRDSRDNPSLVQRDACVHEAIARAVTRVGQPELIAVYNENHREHLPLAVALAQSH
jgi:UrcA family protein